MKRILVVALAACGSDGAKQADAAIDTRLPDALIDAPAPPPNAHRYVIDRELMPTNNQQARMYGLDLNNDGQVDNQLGMVIGTLSAMGFDVQATIDHTIDTGASIMLPDLEAVSLASGPATFTIFQGANPMPAACAGANDPTCRHHLAGTATFDVAATSPRDAPLAGTISGGVLDAGPGTVHVATTFFGAPLTLALIGARVRLTQASDTEIMTGVVAGAVPVTELDSTVYPSMATAITAQIAVDCTALTSPPQCGCASGSAGDTEMGLFDANQDCAVTADEIKTNSLIMSLLAPDVTIGTEQALSFGVGITAVHAAFVP